MEKSKASDRIEDAIEYLRLQNGGHEFKIPGTLQTSCVCGWGRCSWDIYFTDWLNNEYEEPLQMCEYSEV